MSPIIMEEAENDSSFGYADDAITHDNKKSGFLPEKQSFFEQDSEKIIETTKNKNGQMMVSSEKSPKKAETESVVFGDP